MEAGTDPRAIWLNSSAVKQHPYGIRMYREGKAFR
jgi:hypothetical protein